MFLFFRTVNPKSDPKSNIPSLENESLLTFKKIRAHLDLTTSRYDRSLLEFLISFPAHAFFPYFRNSAFRVFKHDFGLKTEENNIIPCRSILIIVVAIFPLIRSYCR